MIKVLKKVYLLYIRLLKYTFSSDLKVLNWFIRKVSSLLGYQYLNLALVPISDCLKGNELIREKELVTYGPKEINEEQNSIRRVLPALCFYEIDAAVVHPSSPIIVSNSKAYFQLYPLGECTIEMIDFAHAHVLAQNKEQLLVNVNAKTQIEKGIFLGGSWSKNWYHWTIEILSRVELIESLPETFKNYPLIVPQQCVESKNHFDFLKLIFKNRVFKGVDSTAAVEKLIYVDSPAISTPKLIDDSRVDRLATGLFRTDVLKDYRYRIIKELEKSNNIYTDIHPKRIFLARKQNSRTFNQNEVINSLSKYSFKAVYLEELTVMEQLKLLQNVDFIIGSTGAAWANILFSKARSAIIWMPEFVKGWPIFSTLAKTAEVDMTYLRFPTVAKNWVDFMLSNEEYEINLDVLEELVQKKINDTSN